MLVTYALLLGFTGMALVLVDWMSRTSWRDLEQARDLARRQGRR